MKDRLETEQSRQEAVNGEEGLRILSCPNIVLLCIDSYDGERQKGRMYHQYTGEPICFESLLAAFGQMDAFFDAICFPYASVRPRSFYRDRKAEEGRLKRSRILPKLPEYKRKDMIKMASFEDVTGHRGTDATFVIRVQHRQHASWQGEVTWIDGQKKESFRSALELLRLMDGALNGEEKAFGE